MVMKIIIVSVLLFIVGSMGLALFSMMKDKGQTDRTVKALTLRISLSIGLLIFIMIGYAAGFITPNSL